MAQAGHDLIFTTSFGFMNATANVAQQFPHVKFEHATGYTRADNLATYDARFYEGRHVAGIIAGHMTESNIIGYIAAYPIPEVIQGINSAFLAARSVNPDVEVIPLLPWAFQVAKFNHALPPTDDVNFRRAVYVALDCDVFEPAVAVSWRGTAGSRAGSSIE